MGFDYCQGEPLRVTGFGKPTSSIDFMRIPVWAVVFLLFCETSLGLELEPEPEEGPPVFFAISLLDEDVLTGEFHQVAPVVRVERFRYRFTLLSEFGTVDVWGIEGVKEGAAELQAISLLKKIEQTESFARAFSAALKAPVVQMWSVAKRPVQTVTGIPIGINRYLLGKFYQVKRESRRAASYVRKKTSDKNETVAETREPEKEGASKKLSQGTSKLSRKHLGFNKAKRQWAQRLRVDPYSKNELLQQELGRIAWASSLGSFSADFVIPGSDALSYAGRAESVVWSKSPTELERLNDVALKKMNFDKEKIAAFHDNRLYSLTQKVEIVMALKEMGEFEGKSLLRE